jgi:signal transduction histidine kinase
VLIAIKARNDERTILTRCNLVIECFRNRIFNPMFTTKADGMGMGLSICRSIVEAYEGRICVSAEAGKGAIVQFTVPLDQASRP